MFWYRIGTIKKKKSGFSLLPKPRFHGCTASNLSPLVPYRIARVLSKILNLRFLVKSLVFHQKSSSECPESTSYLWAHGSCRQSLSGRNPLIKPEVHSNSAAETFYAPEAVANDVFTVEHMKKICLRFHQGVIVELWNVSNQNNATFSKSILDLRYLFCGF